MGSKRSRLDIIEDDGKNEDRNLSIRGPDIRGTEECLGFHSGKCRMERRGITCPCPHLQNL